MSDSGSASTGSKRERQAEQRRNQLIDTALTLFAEHGIEATRVSDIAQTAGVAQGLLYHYFPTQRRTARGDHRAARPAADARRRAGDAARPPGARDAAHRGPTPLRPGAGAAHATATDRARNHLAAETRGMGMAVREQALTMLARYLQSRVAAGELRPHDSLVVGQTLASAIIVVVFAQLPVDPYLTGAIDVILQGISAQPADASAPAAETTTGG